MVKRLPIIYVRGYAGGNEAVESTANLPYYGFNLGSTQVRTGSDGEPDFFIFESPLVRLRLLLHYVRERRVLRERHYFGEHLFQDTLTVGIRDDDGGGGQLVRARWTALDADMPQAGIRHPRGGDIRFELASRHLAGGELVLRV